MAALQKRIETDEEGAVLKTPRVRRALLCSLRLVVEICALERDTVLEAHFEIFDSLLRLLNVFE
jgi:hypothetical protein